MTWRLATGLLLSACLAGAAAAQSSRPDPAATPGATNPHVSQATIDGTICAPGWARLIRPPARYTSALKRQQLAALGWLGSLRSWEEDHLIPLELGGAPTSPLNLWPQPRYASDGWTAAEKDRLETALHRLVCQRQLALRLAQTAIAADWHAAFRTYAGRRR